MTCNTCRTVTKLYGSAEAVTPWHCKCHIYKSEPRAKRLEQKLITHQCQCRTKVLKTGRRIVYCRCSE